MPAKIVKGINNKIANDATIVLLLKFLFILGVCTTRGGSLLRPTAKRKTESAANRIRYT